MLIARRCLTLIGLSCLLLSSCGDGKPRRVPVNGTVLYNGQPLPGGDVVFVPADLNTGFRARGKADAEGQFSLTTFSEGDGAIPGEYKVTVFAYRPRDPKLDADMIAPRVGFPAVPKKYFDHQTTDLTATVNDEPTVVQLQLKD